MKIIEYIFIGTIGGIFLWGGGVQADGPTEMNERILAPLANAGISMDDKTLVDVLNHTNKFLASRAAVVLGTRGENQRVLAALAKAASDNDETLAIAAMRSLHILNDSSWCQLGMDRLNHIKNRALQIQLAELLAEAGHVDGWNIIAAAILDSDYSSLALQSVDAFDMGIINDGKRLDVAAELRRIAIIASEDIQKNIRQKLKE